MNSYHRGDRIALPYLRCYIKEYSHKGIHRILKPERKDRTQQWVSYWQVEQTLFSDPNFMSEYIWNMNKKAQRIINLNAQTQATKRVDAILDDKAREKFKSWVDKRYGHLSEIYTEDRTTIFAGMSETARDTQREFYKWVPSYLAEKDRQEELTTYKEKKQSLGVKW